VDLVISTPNVKFTTQFGAQAPAFQIGEVLDAQVLQLLDDGRARLAVANLIIDVLSEVPLVPGTTVKLAVKGTGDAIKLVLIDPEAAAAAESSAAQAGATATSTGATLKAGQAGPLAAKIDAPASPPSPPVQPPPLSPPDALAQATRLAAVQQDGLAPLFADVEAALQSAALPPEIWRAATLLLGMRPVLDENLSAAEVKQAIDGSGTFFEARLAAAPSNAVQSDDFKAALIVFRQVLRNWVGTAGEGAGPPPAGSDEMTAAQALLRGATVNEAPSIAGEAGASAAAKLETVLPGLLAANLRSFLILLLLRENLEISVSLTKL
jgi:hypothetical protein